MFVLFFPIIYKDYINYNIDIFVINKIALFIIIFNVLNLRD